uniref:Uncharacterized protein n=1 Tax=Tetranychus urticae TaxID=32264 RepID=T1K0B4_TETUR
MENAPESDPHQLKADQFIDTQAFKDFTCIICMDIVAEHYRSQTCSNCLESLCPNTCLRAYKVSNPSYTRKCPACRVPFRFRNRPRTGPKSVEEFKKLKSIVLAIRPRCLRKGGNQEIHLGYCIDELSSLNAELDAKRQMLRRTVIEMEVHKQVSELREEKIEELEAKLKQKDLELQQKSSIKTVSNPMRSSKAANGSYTKFIVRYLNQTFQINNLSLDDQGHVLRSEIERQVGSKVGTILRANHTIVDDDRLLRQHQFCYKPTIVTVLPTEFTLKKGSRLNIQINSVSNKYHLKA